MWKIWIDEGKGRVMVTLSGLMTPEDADRFGHEMNMVMENARNRFGVLHALLDASAAPVQPAETVARLQSPEGYLQSSEDRYAVVVATSLGKMQARRLTPEDQVGIFMSMAEADEWLG